MVQKGQKHNNNYRKNKNAHEKQRNDVWTGAIEWVFSGGALRFNRSPLLFADLVNCDTYP